MSLASFWQQLAHPILGLSPMDGVTDHPFRFIQKKYGQPTLIYTEFTSVEGVCHGADRLLQDFLFDESQRPIIAQVYGTTPDFFRQTAIILCELGFDGIDINMGCPAKNVAHSGAGASLIKTPDLAQAIIRATKQGIQEWVNGATSADCPDISKIMAAEVARRHSLLPAAYQARRTLPVSVKTRLGYSDQVVASWIPALLEMDLSAITIHGRTLKQHHSGPVDWEAIAQAVELAKGSGTLILGNGDVTSKDDAREKATTYGVAGALIGRASMGNPYVFLDEADRIKPLVSTFQIAVEHSQLYEKTFQNGAMYNFLPMRKHLGWYVKSIPNAAQIRIELFKTNNSQEVKAILEKYDLINYD